MINPRTKVDNAFYILLIYLHIYGWVSRVYLACRINMGVPNH